MSRFAVVAGFFVGVLWMASVVAQSPAPGSDYPPMRAIAEGGGTGVSNARIMDRQEIRISRVDVEAGGVRVLHTHDDVPYHLVVPITGPLELNLGTPTPVSLVAWQPYFMTRGTRHGFQNNGRSKVSVLEIFVKQ